MVRISEDLKIKIGQLFLLGFQNDYYDENIQKLIKDYKVGNIILFARNVSDFNGTRNLNKKLSEEIEKETGIYPFIAIDAEGGLVSRLGKVIGEYPSHYMLGNINDESFAYKTGFSIGRDLYNLGINMNLAPVVDINSNPENPVIGTRAFSNEKEVVTNMGRQFAKGLKDASVVPILKHFPGHGDTNVDSHVGLPIIDLDLEQLEERELVPFKEILEEDNIGVMAAHVIMSKISQYPSSLSEEIINGILREKLGFNGLVVSDCFEMSAIMDNYKVEDSVPMAINAGVNMLDISHTIEYQIKAIEGLYKAVEEERVSVETIEKAYETIIYYKENIYNLIDDVREKSINIKGNFDFEGATFIAPNYKINSLAEDKSDINIGQILSNLKNGTNIVLPDNFDEEYIKSLVEEVKDKRVVVCLNNFHIFKNHKLLFEALENSHICLVSLNLINEIDRKIDMKIDLLEYSISQINSLIKRLWN